MLKLQTNLKMRRGVLLPCALNCALIFIFNEAEMLKGRSLNRITPILHSAAAFNSA
jgi:hypothetical protein